MTIELAISPLQLEPLHRDYYGQYDAWAVSQLAPLADEECYTPKFYKAPASADELILANGYASYGLHISPGSLIFGFYLPALVSTFLAPSWICQITDVSMNHKFFSEPISAAFLANFKPTYLESSSVIAPTGQVGSFPTILEALHPVVGDGIFRCEFWDTLAGNTYPSAGEGFSQRIELVFGVLEVAKKC